MKPQRALKKGKSFQFSLQGFLFESQGEGGVGVGVDAMVVRVDMKLDMGVRWLG
jgi:hypothetical protein